VITIKLKVRDNAWAVLLELNTSDRQLKWARHCREDDREKRSNVHETELRVQLREPLSTRVLNCMINGQRARFANVLALNRRL